MRLIFPMILLAAFCTQSTYSQEHQALLEYAANVSKVRTIECTELLYVPNEPVYANSPPESGMRFESYWLAKRVYRKADLVHDYSHFIVETWPKRGFGGKGGLFREVKSLVDGERRSYVDPHAPGYTGEKKGYGQITEMPIKEIRHIGPHTILGFGVNEILNSGGPHQNLSDNILTRKVDKLDDNTFIIREFEGPGQGASVQFHLSPEHDYMPDELVLRYGKGNEIEARIKVDEFAKIDSCWIPTKAVGSSSVNGKPLNDFVLVFPRESIKLNFAADAEYFVCKFPADVPYVNRLTGKYYLDGKETGSFDVEEGRKELEKIRAFEKLVGSSHSNWLYHGYGLGIFVLLFVVYFGAKFWRFGRHE